MEGVRSKAVPNALSGPFWVSSVSSVSGSVLGLGLGLGLGVHTELYGDPPSPLRPFQTSQQGSAASASKP
eukprot:1196357-Prorocentrum_minimum.AAC.9